MRIRAFFNEKARTIGVLLTVVFSVLVMADAVAAPICVSNDSPMTQNTVEQAKTQTYVVMDSPGDAQQTLNSSPSVHRLLSETDGVLSPDGKRIAFISTETGRPEIWVINIDGTGRKRISELPCGQGAANPVWSPNSNLIAFTSYNLEGHSPLTTAHVWIVKPDGSEGRRIILPEPDARFSTFSPAWISDKVLQVRDLVLQPGNKLVENLYIYNYETEEFLKCNLQRMRR